MVLDGAWLSCILTLFTKSKSIKNWHGYHDEHSIRCRYFSQMKHILDVPLPLFRLILYISSESLILPVIQLQEACEPEI
jgi:hypothetical protein